ncbi:MAG: ATP-binding protein [Peptococcaceae bacterium]|nr:ATP-binding protein [Peptococcaceae bacterium]
METRRPPVGHENFEEIRTEDFYYVDKTSFITTLMCNRGKANLFTRPRRFGKTLNMSMLQSFFEINRNNQDLFAGLDIAQEPILCKEHMNKYPVIFLTLKSVEAEDFTGALARIGVQVANECRRLSFLAQSQQIGPDDQSDFMALKARTATPQQLKDSLKTLSRILESHFGQKVVLLIDEYDVPLDKAFHRGYYDKMISFMRIFLGEALKTNSSLKFAVITGCLRISRESIFTGLNNLKVYTITDPRHDEHFGFTDEEIKRILEDYNLSSAYEELRQWYNGYRFGKKDVYCPWDIMNHVDRLLADPQAEPESYWNNTSSNDMVRRFIDKADSNTRYEIEQLVAGGYVEKAIKTNLTYAEVDESLDNLWSVLFLTGYLTQQPTEEKLSRHTMRLRIPNEEVKEIFIEKIQNWFAEKVRNSSSREEMEALYCALLEGDCNIIEKILTAQLRTTISYHDTYEGYYHGFLAGLLKGGGFWGVSSNRETGDGRSDLLIVTEDGAKGIIIEVKRANSLEDIPIKCQEALRQAETRNYADAFLERGLTRAGVYGIAFWKKNCGVAKCEERK